MTPSCNRHEALSSRFWCHKTLLLSLSETVIRSGSHSKGAEDSWTSVHTLRILPGKLLLRMAALACGSFPNRMELQSVRTALAWPMGCIKISRRQHIMVTAKLQQLDTSSWSKSVLDAHRVTLVTQCCTGQLSHIWRITDVPWRWPWMDSLKKTKLMGSRQLDGAWCAG